MNHPTATLYKNIVMHLVVIFANFASVRWLSAAVSLLLVQFVVPAKCQSATGPIPLATARHTSSQQIHPIGAGLVTSPVAARGNARKSQSRQAQSDQSPLVIVRTHPGHDYPGVWITPPGDVWDLTDTPVVTMTVRNESNIPIDVILSLENANSHGKHGVSAEKVHLPAGQSGTLEMITGTWHGSASDRFDPSRVTGLRVMLDQPPAPAAFSVLEIVATDDAAPIQHILASDYFDRMEPFFGRGVNIGNTLEAPREGDWGGTVRKSHLRSIRLAGFDSIRLPVRWSAHASEFPPYRLDAGFRRRVRQVIDDALRQGLGVIVNDHHYGELVENPSRHRQRFLSIWRQIASEYAHHPDGLAFEIMNEPHGKLDATLWNDLLADVVGVIRQDNPDRWIVVGPVRWNSVDALQHLRLPKGDPRIAMTFHYYLPMEVTHQGAPWMGQQGRRWLGTGWTGNSIQQTRIRMDFNKALKFGYENKVPVFLGEFGVYEKAPMQTRVTWTRAVAQAAAQRRMGYAYWEFYTNFGLYDPVQLRWHEDLKDAVLDP